MLLYPSSTRPLDDLAEAIDAVISEIDRQHAIHSIDVEYQDEYVVVSTLSTFVDGTTDQEAIAGNKIVDGGTIMMPMASMMKRLRRLARMSGK